jgi:hypothetical protein
MYRRPQPRKFFFQQAILQQRLGQRFFQLRRLTTKFFDLVTVGLPGRVSRQALLAGLQKLLRPAVVQVLVDAFLAA